ncbi:MAG TPA: hypothetical protein VK815_14555, partial [Candidatus Acidoferrales bacterium]|nr:hypothetical protein [Candidatus Acidoferrales bacterium]
MKKTLTIILCGLTLAAGAAPKKLISPIISGGKDGKLTYDVDERGNRVPDFSSAGYAGGDRPIPDAPVRMTVSPMAGDETARIQRAIDYVAGLPVDTNGIRGAVLLLKGRHEVAGNLKISGSGVVLRGQGEGKEGTTVVATGIDRRTLIRVAGKDDLAGKTDDGWAMTDEYVPVGALSFHVKDASALKPGAAVRVVRPGTKEWIDFLGMTDFGGGINDWRLVWHAGNYDIAWQREIRKIEGNTVTVDAPVTTALEAKFGGGHVETYSWPGRVENIGIENLSLDSEFNAKNAKDENHAWFAVTMENCRDAWVRDVTFRHFAGSAVALYESCQKVTVADCVSLAPVSEDAGWRRNTFFTTGQQTLFLRCRAEAGRHDFATGTGAAGPNAFVDCESDLPTADSGAIGSWASGTLFDNVRIDGHRLDLMNRGGDDGGAGWSAANCVLWNCIAAKVACDSPPGAQNWAFGSWGEFEGHGVWRDSNTSAKLDYLYGVQLGERVGAARANAFMEEGDITAEPGDARPVDEFAAKPARNDSPQALISVTNG